MTRLSGHHTYILSPGFSADGRLLVTAEVDAIVRLWSLPGGRAFGPPLRFREGVYDAQLSPDGRRIALVLFARERSARYAGGPRRREPPHCGSRAHQRQQQRVRFSPDGRLVAVGNNSGRAQVWSTRRGSRCPPRSAATPGARAVLRSAGTEARSPPAATTAWSACGTSGPGALGAPLPGVAQLTVVPSFTADGTHLLAAYEAGDAYLWDIRPESLRAAACRAAGRRLTRAEWGEFLLGRDYEPAC